LDHKHALLESFEYHGPKLLGKNSNKKNELRKLWRRKVLMSLEGRGRAGPEEEGATMSAQR
jgi:hypothetical protein